MKFRKLVQGQSLVQKKCYQQLLFLILFKVKLLRGVVLCRSVQRSPKVQYSPDALVKQIHEQARTAVSQELLCGLAIHCQDFGLPASRSAAGRISPWTTRHPIHRPLAVKNGNRILRWEATRADSQLIEDDRDRGDEHLDLGLGDQGRSTVIPTTRFPLAPRR